MIMFCRTEADERMLTVVIFYSIGDWSCGSLRYLGGILGAGGIPIVLEQP